MSDRSHRDHFQVTMTTPTEDEAARLGRMAVEQRLAACAQVSGPITSTYRWAGEITSAPEWVCTMKTTSDRLVPLFAALRHAHSYEVPEIVAVPLVAGDPDYLAWVEEGSRATDP
jgi:periplasmic divalent cation tolerance protein